MERYIEIIKVALEAVFANRSRSILTALGIIFGVAAVIAMMAIGKGAQQEILDQMKMVGVNNIIIQSKYDKSASKSTDDSSSEKEEKNDFSSGLTMLDAESVSEIIPTVANISPEVSYESAIISDGKRRNTKIIGVLPAYFKVLNLTLEAGSMFTERQIDGGAPVCIIGSGVKTVFFPLENPIGKNIKCGNVWLTIVGVLESPYMEMKSRESLWISDNSYNIFAPINTVLLRFKDRTQLSETEERTEIRMSGNSMSISSSTRNDDDDNYHQLDRIVVQVDESGNLAATTEILSRMMLRRHHGVADFEVVVPELLLKQEQRTKDIFNIVLGAIAGISLLVGGIGIMNIMLASVMERIREIGVRRSIGATKRDIVLQFLAESIFISITGGILGIILGVVMAIVIQRTTDILTIVSAASVFISFGVSVGVGIIFGYLPAKRAAEQDPVTSLRHD
jgi:ABC-type antimicrobial peptide transport system, permease component